MAHKPNVAFVCVHNSCRSQMAEALGKLLAGDTFHSFSAGTETKPHINPDAVRLMKERYGVDMEQTQYSKLLSELPPVDIVITMGCNVSCPTMPCRHREDWGLEDPSGKPDADFLAVMERIRHNILSLKERIQTGNRGETDKKKGDDRCAVPLFSFRFRPGKTTKRQLHLCNCLFLLVPVVGLEPTRCRHQRILSPSRLPIPSYRHISVFYYSGFPLIWQV